MAIKTPEFMEAPLKLLNRNYLIQFQGQTVSRLGSQLLTAALVFWVKDATDSATIMGLAAFISGVPAILLMPLGGAVADRFPRRTIIIVSDLIRSSLLLILAILLLFTPDAKLAILAMLLVSSTAANVIGSFFGPAISATIPDLVPPNRLTAANSLGQLSVQGSMFIGQALGGVLYRLLGAGVLVLINALTFLYSSISELFVRIPQTIPERAPDWRQQLRVFGADIREGVRYILQVRGLREVVGLSAILSFFSSPILVLMAFYVEDTLGARPDWYGFILAAQGVGAILGYVLAGVLALAPAPRARVIIAMTLVAAAAEGMLGFLRTPLQAVAFSVLAGIANGFVTVHITTLVQTITHSEIRGRIMGVLAAISGALVPVSMGLAGIVADLVGQNIPLIYVSCGAIMLISAAALATNRDYRSILATPFSSDAGRDAGRAEPPGPAAADEGERTRDVYEDIAGYEKPPRPPLPGASDLDEVLARLDQPKGTPARRITDVAFAITGFRSFLVALPGKLDAYQRTYNTRLPGLYGPVVSATVALKDDPGVSDGPARAASLILGALELQRDVFAGRLEPDTLRGAPLEMGQYPNFFSTSQVIEDGAVRFFKSTRFDRLNVIANGRFHIVQLPDGAPPTFESLRMTLASIARMSREADVNAASPGSLTCASPAVQLRAFTRMRGVKCNAEALAQLRHTVFTVCLDDDAPSSLAEAARLAHSQNPHNRWFHAGLQLVVFANGKACTVCNFSAYLDGNVMTRGSAEILRRATRHTGDGSAAAAALLPITTLQWEIPAPALAAASADRGRVLDTQPATFELMGYGREAFAAYGVKASAAFVLALQAAANTLTGRRVRISQFLAMSRYRYNDLAEVQVSSAETHAFAEYAADAGFDTSRARQLLDLALASEAAAIRQGRQWLPLPDIITLFLMSSRGAARLYRALVFRLRALLLRRLGTAVALGRDVMISFPAAFEEAPIVGRPGIRLPYTRDFGLHYQMLADRTVVTFMPGVDWRVPNTELVERLRGGLATVLTVLEATAARDSAATAERSEP